MKKKISFLFLKILGLILISAYFPLHYISTIDTDPLNLYHFKVLQIIYVTLGVLLLLVPRKLFYGFVDKFRIFFAKLLGKKQNKFANLIIIIFLLIILSIYPIHIFKIYSQLAPPTSFTSIGTRFLVLSLEPLSFFNIIVNSFSNPYEVDRDKIEIPIYDIYLKQDKIDQLNLDLPESGRNYTKGYLQIENRTTEAKVKYRGWALNHWLFPKKSKAIRYKKEDVQDFTRRFDLIVPEKTMQIERPFYYFLAEQFGVLSPKSEGAAVFLNKQYNGYYHYFEFIDEGFLINHDKMPGLVFRGDFGNLYESPEEWEIRTSHLGKKAENASQVELDIIDSFIKGINQEDDKELYKFITKHMMQGMPYIALLQFIGDEHVTDGHNQEFYFDPTSGQYEAILNDPIIATQYTNLNKAATLYARQTIKFPDLVNKKNKILYNYLISEDNVHEVHEFIDISKKESSYAIKKDLYKIKDNSNYFMSYNQWADAVERIDKRVDSFRQNILQDLEDSELKIYLTEDGFLIFDVYGNAGLNIEYIETNKEICYQLQKVIPDHSLLFLEPNIAYDNNVEISTKGCGTKIMVNETLYPGLKQTYVRKWNSAYEYEPSVLRYSYKLDAEDIDLINLIAVKGTNDITGALIEPEFIYLSSIKDLSQLEEVYSTHPWNYIEKDEAEEIVFQGVQTLEKNLVIGKNDVLEIKPGTTILMAPNVSIIVYGKIYSAGTNDEKIVFKQLAEGQPWGAIALQGKGTSGSLFEFTEFIGGSGADYDLVEYTGMLSAYNANLTCHNCILRDNHLEDDMINVKGGYVNITNSELINAYGDAIDLDICTGIIDNVKIVDSINDGIDLMSSDVVLSNNRIIRAGDKGFSVGEGSNPLIIGNLINESNFGIVTKDASNPMIKNNIISGSKTAGLAAYTKKWLYSGGGHGTLINNSICGNDVPILLDMAGTEEPALPYFESGFEIIEEDEDETVEVIECTLEECDYKC